MPQCTGQLWRKYGSVFSRLLGQGLPNRRVLCELLGCIRVYVLWWPRARRLTPPAMHDKHVATMEVPAEVILSRHSHAWSRQQVRTTFRVKASFQKMHLHSRISGDYFGAGYVLLLDASSSISSGVKILLLMSQPKRRVGPIFR